MNEKLQLSEEFSAQDARLRVDVYGTEPREHVLDDLTFLNYRLADVRISPTVTLAGPDIVWHQAGDMSVRYDGRTVTFTGPWLAGPLQKVIVAVLALRMEAKGLHPSHSAAVNYRGKTLMFLGGESNHGKSMGLIEAGVRGGLQVASETTVISDDGRAVAGSVEPFLIKRTHGTERSDKAAPNKGVEKFWGDMPKWGMYTGDAPNVDLVIVPAIDGNFDPATNKLIPFEAQFQFLHSLQNYLLTNELLLPGNVIPMLDNDELRQKRAVFVERFCDGRPFFFIRAATPQVLLDEVDKVL